MEEIRLSIVVPAYDEEERIGPALDRIGAFLRDRPGSSEVIVVDDGSRDGTAARAAEGLARIPGGRLLTRPINRGKGFSVREGVLASRGGSVLFTDADLSTPVETLDAFRPWLDRGYDIVIGSRAHPGSDIQVRQSLLRETMGKAFNLFLRTVVGTRFRDTQCGFKLFRGEAARAIFSRVKTRGFSFDVEVLRLAEILGYRVREAPVVWRNSPSSRVKVVRSSAGMLKDAFLIRRRCGRGGAAGLRESGG